MKQAHNGQISVCYLDRYVVYYCGCIYDLERQKFLTHYHQSSGYRQVAINKRKRYLHRVVSEAFNGKIPEGMEVNHDDGNKDNNMLYNLEVMTKSRNQKHSFANGLNQTPRERIMQMVAARKKKSLQE